MEWEYPSIQGTPYQAYVDAVVSEVIDGGGAQEAGIKVNDMIIAIDGEQVESFAQLVNNIL